MSNCIQDNLNVAGKKNKKSLRKNMSMFVKGRWFPLIITLIVLAVFVLVMALLGWRFTYAPKLESSWDAISAVAAWAGVVISAVGVIASFIAIWYAIQVPKKIADRQDKIALFERRYECFQFFEECFVLYKKSADKSLADVINVQCCHMLGVQKIEDLNRYDFHNKVKHFEYLLHQMEFLFPGIQEKDVSKLYNTLSSYLAAILDQKDIEKNRQEYISAMKEFGRYTNEIWDSMTISNIL